MNRKLLEDLKTTGYTPEIVKHEAISMIEEQEKEIEILNKKLDTSIEICNNRQKEIVRLNNIINELEEEISRHIALCTDVTLNDILDKLKELKENK